MADQKAAAPQQQQKQSGTGIVKAVNSADSIVIFDGGRSAAAGPPQTRELYFSQVQAPRLARREGKDEPYAWAAREHLRRLAIGKQVRYTIDFTSEQGRAWAQVHTQDGKSLAEQVALAGWVTVKQPPEGKDPRSPYHAALLQATAQAQEQKIGIFQDVGDSPAELERVACRLLPQRFDSFALFEKLKGKQVQAQIEYVRDGSTVRVILLPTYHRILLHLSGAQAPNLPPSRKQDSSKKPFKPAEPFAQESQFFVDRYLLHRDVQVTLRGVGKNDDYYGVVTMEGRDLAGELIRQGLARFVEWSAPPQDLERLRSFEEQAKLQKLRMWRNYDPAKQSAQAAQAQTFQGKVREVRDGGVLVITDTASSPAVHHTISLSSVSVPFGSEAFAHEAREILRQKLIGRKVTAKRDYVRAAGKAQDGRELAEKSFWTVHLERMNVAVLLIERGYARVVSREDGRSAEFEQLSITERKAQSQNKGRWNKNADTNKRHVTDLTLNRNDPTRKQEETKRKTKQFLPFLERAGLVSGVIEYVFSASRFKLFVPKENCIISFSLGAIRTPARGDSLADEAMEWVRDRLHQRDVEIVVETLDRGGNFIGAMFLKKRNVATTLLEHGYARVGSGKSATSPYIGEFREAELKAKQRKIKIWTNYDPDAEAAAAQAAEHQDAADHAEKKPELVSVKVSEIVDGGWFFVQKMDALPQLTELMATINAGESPVVAGFSPHKGELCLARNPTDGDKLYRARVENVVPGAAEFDVTFVDYGNVATVKAEALRPIESQHKQPGPFALECCCAFLRVPSLREDYGEDAAVCFKEFAWGKTLMANIEYRDQDRAYITLGDPESSSMINVILVTEGLATIDKRSLRRNRRSTLIARLNTAQEEAHRNHRCLWEYGDLPEDDEE